MAKIAVIGAGASGIIAALKLSEKNDVLLLEKNEKIGKKILATGNGKCNLWNTNIFKDSDYHDFYYTDNYEMLNSIFEYKNETYSYLTNELGIFIVNKGGYIYPYSQTSSSIRETFEKQITANDNIELITNFEITKIEKNNDRFKVYNKDEYYEVDKVVLSCGYKSSNLGTDSLDNILGSTDVVINNSKPALVPITISSPYLKRWNGIRTNVKLSIITNGNPVKSDIGEIQLTDYGLSGIVSLNLSSYINRHNNADIKIEIDFTPDEDLEFLLNLRKEKYETVEQVLETMFNYKLLFIILEESNINKDKEWNRLSKDEINNLIYTIKHFTVTPNGTLNYDRSQVTSGGISLNEINDNLELKNIKNMYVIGEILDIDGICGGYNLANAFITGYIVGRSINND